jgi:hypothetical protein
MPSFLCRRMRPKIIREAVIPKKSLKRLLGAMWNEVAEAMLDRYIRAGNHRGYYA